MTRIRDLPAHLQPMARAALRGLTDALDLPTPASALPTAERPLVLDLPEPPSLNEMLDLAKQRRHGKPIVYAQEKAAYELLVIAAVRRQGYAPPRVPWHRWRLERAAFRLHQLRDPIELLAGLKWTVDALVAGGWFANDSPRHLRGIPDPEQVVDREQRGVILLITPIAAGEE